MTPTRPTPSADFWKRKLAAFLHDPPTKCLNIPEHREKSRTAMMRAGFTEEEVNAYDHEADWAAAAADRLPFPASRPAGLACAFDGHRNRFHHPLVGSHQLGIAPIKSDALGTEVEQFAQPQFISGPNDTSAELWRNRFFAHWRLWCRDAQERDHRLAFLPADTRIPDHTIWNHMQVVSTLAGTNTDGGPAFLRVQIGGVQEFIAQSRNTRDLWSGSYLISWLMAAGLKTLSEQIGPDTVIFPNLLGQPLFDRVWRNDIWAELHAHPDAAPAWERLNADPADQLTPNLPNVFLALVPANQAAVLGRFVAESIQSEFCKIADRVWHHALSADIVTAEDKRRFDTQIARALNISWQAQPWPADLDAACALANGAPSGSPLDIAASRVKAIRKMAEQDLPPEHRDWRYYVGGKDGPKGKLNNVGLAWSIMVAHQQAQLDAVRQTYRFTSTNAGNQTTGRDHTKDALIARDEALVGGEVLRQRIDAAGGAWSSLFKKTDPIAALTLLKRTWHVAYLVPVWGFDAKHDFRMPSTRGIASHEPLSSGDDEADTTDLPASDKYFAVIALDGDEIGKWVSGAKTPPHRDQLAAYADGSGNPTEGAVPYFKRQDMDAFLASPRALSPSYHLQFSAALSNFALHCARPIVEAFNGRLIYAGGDDVVALLPADNALRCAEALRAAFRGTLELPELLQKANTPPPFTFTVPAVGFLARSDACDQHGRGTPVPFIVPGPAADCSVGIAISHFKAPLQDAVRAAQAAEKRAKSKLDRAAVAVSLFKRSGEITEWGCKWELGGLDLHQAVADHLENGTLGARFPHRVCALLEPYLNRSDHLANADGFDATAIISREFEFAATRQGSAAVAAALKPLLATYLKNLPGQHCEAVIGLCTAVAFAHRTRAEQPTE